MTHEEFITMVRKPELVRNDQVSELKELIDLYPYFAPVRLFHVKALKQSNNIQFSANLTVSSLYCASRRWLYYYLYPEKLIVAEPFRRDQITKSKSAGDYFDMLKIIETEGGDTNQSLKNLAERLKLARKNVVSASSTPIHKPVAEKYIYKVIIPKIENTELEVKQNYKEVSENFAKKLILQRKYSEAIEILRELNLNNPKKSVYFADQIRFLEKIIVNSKK